MSRRASAEGTSYREEVPWQVYAACRGHEPELWFADSKDLVSQGDRERAKTICRTCPVKAACLAAVLTLPPAQDAHGIRGGLDAKERARLRRRKGATP